MARGRAEAAALLRWRRCRSLLVQRHRRDRGGGGEIPASRAAAARASVPDRFQPDRQERRRAHPSHAGAGPGTLAGHRRDLYPATALTYGDVPRANNEALARVYHLAAEFDLPVLLHANVTSKRERNPLYLAEIEEPLRNHPHVRFIWAHAGTSMEIHRHQKKLDFLLPTLGRLLQRYPNLYIDLSWSVLRPYLLDEQGKPDPQWLALVERFPQRFMLGSDVVGQFDSLPELMASFDPFLDALPEQVARQVARDNFLAVLPRQPADPRGE
nr:amidohydrolase family protein [Pseudomonas aeruginosa]